MKRFKIKLPEEVYVCDCCGNTFAYVDGKAIKETSMYMHITNRNFCSVKCKNRYYRKPFKVLIGRRAR